MSSVMESSVAPFSAGFEDMIPLQVLNVLKGKVEVTEVEVTEVERRGGKGGLYPAEGSLMHVRSPRTCSSRHLRLSKVMRAISHYSSSL